MSCQATQNLLDGYLDGELDLVRSVEIEGHLKDCPVCAQLYGSEQVLRAALRDPSLYRRAPAELPRSVRAAVRSAAQAEAAPSARPRHFRWQWFSLAATAAVVALAAWIAVPRLMGPSADDRLAGEVAASHIRSLMASHLTDVPSSDQHTVKPWFDGKVNFSPPVGDFASQGFPLIGGRLDYLASKPVAALVYQRRKHFINLFVWPAEKPASAEAKTFERQGYHLLRWTRGGMTFWAVSDLNLAELQEFAHWVQSADAPAPAP